MGKLLFKSNSLLITITCNKKYSVTVTYYLGNKVTVIILHIILLFQQFSNNVSYSYQIEENLANEQQYTYIAKAFKLALRQTLSMPMPKYYVSNHEANHFG